MVGVVSGGDSPCWAALVCTVMVGESKLVSRLAQYVDHIVSAKEMLMLISSKPAQPAHGKSNARRTGDRGNGDRMHFSFLRRAHSH